MLTPSTTTMTTLFRAAALEATRVKWLGEILLTRPMSFTVLTVVAAGMVAVLLGFLAIGSYTARTTVNGQLAPDMGTLKVYPPQPGIVIGKTIHEGQIVKMGDVMFTISSESQSRPNGGVHAEISGQVALRQQSLRDELRQTKQLHSAQDAALRFKIGALIAEQSKLTQQLTDQQLRVDLSVSAVARAKRLHAGGYVSVEMTQQKEIELLDQRNRLQSLERDQINIERDLESFRSELLNAPLHHRNQLAQLERLLNVATQEWSENEGRRGTAVIAPGSGVATAITAEPGQSVDSNRSLVTIIPTGALLEAHLFAPSSAIGFIRRGDPVLLRYQAYPYQKFGHSRGYVTTISRTAMSGNELIAGPTNGAALYRITVRLPSQDVTAYGKPEPLQSGMLVEADVLRDKRKLYEWALEPLFSLTGKF